jgi:serine/threonine-protein kinase
MDQQARNGPQQQQAGRGAAPRPVSQPNRGAGAGEGPVPAFATGQRLGAYTLTQFIGSGGAAHVYKGISPQTGQAVAVKVLVNMDPYVREKFEQEGRLGRKLMHPHIARVLDCSQANGIYFVVMEFVDAGSLRDRMVPGLPAELEMVRTVMRETGSALAYAHENGVVHRDVKPENIMLSSHGGVKLVDFGIARFTQEVTFTSSGMIIGTPYYMSPEQARGDHIDKRTDVYSLGVVMYEMLAGCVPFDGPPLSVARKHIEEPPPVKPLLGAGVPSRLQEVVLVALAKNPVNRYATASALASAVQTAFS